VSRRKVGSKVLNEYQKSRVDYFLNECDLPDYDTDAFQDVGLETLRVHRGVLPPDRALTSPKLARFLHKNTSIYQGKRVLEVGSGSGVLSMVMARHGAAKVVATDIMNACVENTRENARILGLEEIVDVRNGDLFEPVTGERFDIIFFAHPFYCAKPTEGNSLTVAIMDDGGLFKRFLTEAKSYLNPGGKILSPFSDAAGEGNHPRSHAESHGYGINPLEMPDDDGYLLVYELTPA
jgi:SAM-dependent methyltransferase